MPMNCVLSSGVNTNVARLSISNASFPVQGLDVTILHHLSVLLLRPFSPGLEISLRIINHLRNHCRMSYFILISWMLSL